LWSERNLVYLTEHKIWYRKCIYCISVRWSTELESACWPWLVFLQSLEVSLRIHFILHASLWTLIVQQIWLVLDKVMMDYIILDNLLPYPLFTELCTSSPQKSVYIVEVNIQSTTVAKVQKLTLIENSGAVSCFIQIWAHSWTSTWHSHNWCSTIIMDISFAKKFSPALKGKYKSGSKLGSNGADVARSPILTCLNIGRSIAEVVSCKASPERIHKKLGKPNMAACKEP